MARNPIAFLSYVRDDDAHDFNGVTKFRERLEGEVKIQSGNKFEIFQDRNDIRWGQFWQERITESLSDVTFLIPIITPSFFNSPPCRSEFESFLKMEQTLGLSKLILPVYYVSCDLLDGDVSSERDPVVLALKNRNWTDWRPFRFKTFDQTEVREELAKLATNIKAAMKDLAVQADAARQPKAAKPVTKVEAQLPDAKAHTQFPDFENPPWTKSITPKAAPPADQPYWIYTSEFDEVISAAELVADAAQTILLQEYLSKRVADLKRQHSKFFEHYRAIIKPAEDLAVTLLLDNSGSMRGAPISSVASWTTIISEWFDILGIKHEILGYTTRAWKGGQSREKWLADGKPSGPGRLSDLRHIIYKSFDEPPSNVAASCAVMLREGMLKENIDGEALLWAHSRLKREAHAKRVLFVLSDGAPVDDSTLSVNPGNFLEKHLYAVAAWIEQSKDVELRGIGIGQNIPYFIHTQTRGYEEVGIPILEYVFSNHIR